MLFETIFQIGLALSILLCGLVTGFVLLFAIVVMPGIGRLNAQAFLKGFQVMDRIIQENQPLFMLVWGGSAIILILTTILGVGQLTGISRLLLVSAVMIYALGVQLPTIVVNIPLNNRVQTLDIQTLAMSQLEIERTQFEERWNRWNRLRTIMAALTTIILILLMMSL